MGKENTTLLGNTVYFHYFLLGNSGMFFPGLIQGKLSFSIIVMEGGSSAPDLVAVC